MRAPGRSAATLTLAGWVLAGTAAASDYERLAPKSVLVQNATIWTQSDEGILEGHDLLVRDGKIARIGRRLQAPRGAEIVDRVALPS